MNGFTSSTVYPGRYPPPVARLVRYHFTPDERARAVRVGDQRQAFHDKRGTPNSYGLQADHAESLRINRVGALAELCVAAWLGVADQWVEVTADYANLKGDVVPGLEVRSTRARDVGVTLHPRCHDDRIYLGVWTGAANDGGYVELLGWVWGRDGKDEQFWPGKYPERPCFRVPRSALRPMDELPSWCWPDPEGTERCPGCRGLLGKTAPAGAVWSDWCGCPFD